MKIQDDRTAGERLTHQTLVIGTDRILSGWGEAEEGVSYEAKVLRWVESRDDMLRVRVTVDTPRARYRPKGVGHCRIYVVSEGHAALA